MQKALSGPSGTIIGLDYRGEMVLAAHEPVAVLNLGIVAKIDLAEVRAPFVKAGLTSVSIAVLIIFIGIFLFVRIGGSMVRKLELYSQNMEKDIKEQKLAEEKLREINKEQ